MRKLIKIDKSETLKIRISQCQKLKQLREAKNWSKGYVASCLGSSINYISKLENGDQNTTLDFYNKYLLLLETEEPIGILETICCRS